MGRTPKPTALKLLHGDDKKDPGRINRREPKPPRAPNDPPAWLSVAAREVWDQYAPGLVLTGVLTVADIETFASWCDAVIRRRVAAGHITDEGAVIEVPVLDKSGEFVGTRLVKSPWTLALKEADAQVLHWGARFGMTPADRSKIVVGGADRGSATDDLFASSGA